MLRFQVPTRYNRFTTLLQHDVCLLDRYLNNLKIIVIGLTEMTERHSGNGQLIVNQITIGRY